MRVTEASQASRSTALAEVGCGENSRSAPGAPVVAEVVIYLPRRVVPRLGQELDLVETAADEVGRPGHRLEMRKADLASPGRLHGLGQALQVLADRDHVSGSGTGLVTFETDPLDGTRVALLLVIRLGRKAGGHAGSAQEQEVYLTEDLLDLASLLGTVN